LQGDGTRQLETVLSFRMGTHGSAPFGSLTMGVDGNLYGVATDADLPSSGQGTVFRFEPTTRAFTTLHNFTRSQPRWGLTQGPDGNFYGGTCRSTDFESTIFQVTPAGGFTTVHRLPLRTSERTIDPIMGYCPIADLQQAPDGYLYGATVAGGSTLLQYPQLPPVGTVFRMGPGGPGSPYEVVHTFRGVDGEQPMGG
jgi:uncharacterized repeat protein (TIGR03803 family)